MTVSAGTWQLRFSCSVECSNTHNKCKHCTLHVYVTTWLELALKWGMKKKDTNFWSNCNLDTLLKHLKMTVWTSALWKINMQMAKKWPEMVVKRPFMSQFHFESEYILFVTAIRIRVYLVRDSNSPIHFHQSTNICLKTNKWINISIKKSWIGELGYWWIDVTDKI